MTLKQLQYVVTVAETGNITEAAKKLFIAQPSLTAAVHELEKEYGIILFSRSNKGIELTPDGEEFLGYARQVLEQANLIDERYAGKGMGRQRFCVSSQHYSFAVEAFVQLLKELGGDKYEFHMRETQTYDIIEDVARLRSEIGILYLNRFNETVIRKTLRTLFNMLIGLDGYTICSGVISEELNGPNIIAKPLDVDDYMEIGYILPGSLRPSPLTVRYIEILKDLSA